MDFKPGAWVRVPKQTAWGIGQVVRQEGEKVRVLFSDAGEKVLDLRHVSLEQTEPPGGMDRLRPKLSCRAGINLEQLEEACRSFHEQFKNRRPNTDDGRMAMKVWEDMSTHGELTRDSARQLFRWCHTGGSYAEGIELAQRICYLIYGRIPTRAEVEAAGFS
jgi:hypothetical protein